MYVLNPSCRNSASCSVVKYTQVHCTELRCRNSAFGKINKNQRKSTALSKDAEILHLVKSIKISENPLHRGKMQKFCICKINKNQRKSTTLSKDAEILHLVKSIKISQNPLH